MKITLFFARVKPRRKAARPAHHDITSWTTRDWADLPAHHARRD